MPHFDADAVAAVVEASVDAPVDAPVDAAGVELLVVLSPLPPQAARVATNATTASADPILFLILHPPPMSGALSGAR
jgi:hypothetical protein